MIFLSYCRFMKTTADLIPLFQKKSAQIPQYIASKMLEKGLGRLSASHAEILYYLLREGPLKMKIISDRINKDKSTVTALINKLITQGYVRREKSSDDSRSFTVYLTDNGQALKQTFDDISTSLMKDFFKPFSKKELYIMHELISKIQV